MLHASTRGCARPAPAALERRLISPRVPAQGALSRADMGRWMEFHKASTWKLYQSYDMTTGTILMVKEFHKVSSGRRAPQTLAPPPPHR